MSETTTTEVNKPVGSLVIDIFDPQSRNLIFSVIAGDNASKSADKNAHSIDKDIGNVFDHFQPKK